MVSFMEASNTCYVYIFTSLPKKKEPVKHLGPYIIEKYLW